jgi:ectoine hydroxylase-related dioxygenase (phytanoyl-CoA dioxygenase family)
MNPTLSQRQLQQYRDEGYTVLGRIMDDATLEGLRREEARFRGAFNPKELTVFRSQLCHYSAFLREFCTRGAHIPLLGQLIGPNVALWFNQYVTKWPDGNSGKSEFPWHQDNGYVSIEPATNVTIWIALDDVDEKNGCVWIKPDSHKLGLLEHRTKNADSWHLQVPVEGDGVPAILKAGEAVAFTGLTLHRSKLNYSDKPRRAFFMEYADVASQYRRTTDPESKLKPVVMSHNTWVVAGQLDWGTRPDMTLY